MKLKIAQPDLNKALILTGRALSPKVNLPILSNFLVSAGKNKLEVLATDLETAVKAVVDCKVESEGKVAVSGRVLLEYVSQLPGKEVEIEKLGEELVIGLAGYSARLPTMVAEEFPAIPQIEKGNEIRVSAQEFVKGATRVVFCAAIDESRPPLTGVLCDVNKDKFSMVATDGYRLSFQEIKTVKSPVALSMIMPARAIGEVIKILSENAEDLQKDLLILVAGNLTQVNFKIGNVEYTSRLLEGEFPNWQKIIPTAFLTKMKIPKDDLVKLVKVASVFARDAGNIVRLKLDGGANGKAGKLAAFASAGQVGSGDFHSEAAISGKGGEIAFNFRYLLEVLSAIEDEEVVFEMIESLNPGRITIEGKNDFFHIIMPVRLQG